MIILHMKLALPQIGTITVRTDWFMVSKQDENYRVLYKSGSTYHAIYNVKTFEVLFNE